MRVGLSGINLVITDRSQFQSVLTGIEIAVAVHRSFPADRKIDSYSRLLVNTDALERLKRGDATEEIVQSWAIALENFRRTRARYQFYD